jgi:nitroreductase/NAD-dependent dihydropyrimidine dehydrogenase PreA subunit
MTCVRCGLCLEVCPTKSLVFAADFQPKFGKDGEERCTGCQHCLAVCPRKAISICGKDPEESPEISPLPEPDDMIRLIRSRRSIRKYRKEAVPAETIDRLLEMFRWVPTGVNHHSLQISVVRDPAVMEEIRNCVNTRFQEWLKEDDPPECARILSRYKDQIVSGLDVIFRGAPHMVLVNVPETAPCAAVDPFIALSYFELYAKTLGIGTCWCGLAAAALKAVPEGYSRLGIPEGYRLGYAMLFGMADRQFLRATQPEPVPVFEVK